MQQVSHNIIHYIAQYLPVNDKLALRTVSKKMARLVRVSKIKISEI